MAYGRGRGGRGAARAGGPYRPPGGRQDGGVTVGEFRRLRNIAETMLVIMVRGRKKKEKIGSYKIAFSASEVACLWRNFQSYGQNRAFFQKFEKIGFLLGISNMIWKRDNFF